MGRGIDLWLLRREDDHELILDALRQPDDGPETLQWSRVSVGGEHPPTVRLREDNAQELMDQLWRAGLRPTQGRQSEGQVSAMSAHLEDMRAIVFNRLEVEAPRRG